MKVTAAPSHPDVKFAKSDPPGVRTAYIKSFEMNGGGAALEPVYYAVKYIRNGKVDRRWTCTCNNFVHVQQVAGRHCKHIKLVRELVRRMKGWKNIPSGVEVSATAVASEP